MPNLWPVEVEFRCGHTVRMPRDEADALVFSRARWRYEPCPVCGKQGVATVEGPESIRELLRLR